MNEPDDRPDDDRPADENGVDCGGCAGLGYRYRWSGGKRERCPYCHGSGRVSQGDRDAAEPTRGSP